MGTDLRAADLLDLHFDRNIDQIGGLLFWQRVECFRLFVERVKVVRSFFMDMANENFGYLLYAILCLCALCGSSLYAQEVREGALLCRMQRMGTVRYVISRILYAAGSAFLAMILIDLSTSGIIATFFGQGWLYGDVGQSAWRSSLLLQENRRLLYALLLFGRDGL